MLVNKAPAITSAASVSFGVGQAGTFSVTTTGYPVPNLSVAGTLPAGYNFTSTDGTGTGVFKGTNATAVKGTYPIKITATSGAVTTTQNFSIIIK